MREVCYPTKTKAGLSSHPYISATLTLRDGAEVAAAGPALRHASTLSPGQVTSRGAAVISPDERAGRSRAQNPRNLPGPPGLNHSELIIALAARHRLPDKPLAWM